jgi:hypothetical protein
MSETSQLLREVWERSRGWRPRQIGHRFSCLESRNDAARSDRRGHRAPGRWQGSRSALTIVDFSWSASLNPSSGCRGRKRRGNDHEGFRSNRVAQGWWQAIKASEAVGANGLQAGRNSQGHQALGRRMCGTVRAPGHHGCGVAGLSPQAGGDRNRAVIAVVHESLWHLTDVLLRPCDACFRG